MPATELGGKIVTVNGPQAPDPPPYSFHLHSCLWRRHHSASRVTGREAEHREADQFAQGHTVGVQGAGSALHHCTSIAGSLFIASDFSRRVEPRHTSFSTTLSPMHVAPTPGWLSSPVFMLITWQCPAWFFFKTSRAGASLVPCHSPKS